LPDFFEHFRMGLLETLAAFIITGIITVLAYNIWKWEFDRRERKAAKHREAEARGELII
jgi:Tfp pilus assembly protein PilE